VNLLSNAIIVARWVQYCFFCGFNTGLLFVHAAVYQQQDKEVFFFISPKTGTQAGECTVFEIGNTRYSRPFARCHCEQHVRYIVLVQRPPSRERWIAPLKPPATTRNHIMKQNQMQRNDDTLYVFFFQRLNRLGCGATTENCFLSTKKYKMMERKNDRPRTSKALKKNN
jgi:hypothetical protein